MSNKIITSVALLLIIISSSACSVGPYPHASYHYWHPSGYPRHHHWGAPRRLTPHYLYHSPHRFGHKIYHYKGRYRNG